MVAGFNSLAYIVSFKLLPLKMTIKIEVNTFTECIHSHVQYINSIAQSNDIQTLI
jgi:hypothetical protein